MENSDLNAGEYTHHNPQHKTQPFHHDDVARSRSVNCRRLMVRIDFFQSTVQQPAMNKNDQDGEDSIHSARRFPQ